MYVLSKPRKKTPSFNGSKTATHIKIFRYQITKKRNVQNAPLDSNNKRIYRDIVT